MDKKNETAVKIVCPVCKENFCYEDEYSDGSKGYLCYNCGRTSNSNLVPDSEYLEKAILASPDFINDTMELDETRNLIWFLSTINTTSGVVFPEPALDGNWNWVVAKVIPIPEVKRKDYPIPGKDGEFYASRLAIEDGIEFSKYNFYDACQELGGILGTEK